MTLHTVAGKKYYQLIFEENLGAQSIIAPKLLKKEEQLASCPTIYCYLAVCKTVSHFTGHATNHSAVKM